MPTLYAPGTTPVVVTPRGFAVLESGASAALLARVRGVVSDGRGLGGVIEALTSAYGASLTAIPGFAVALIEGDGVRVAVRGDFALDVVAASAERVSGAGVTTWTERVIRAATRVALTTSELDASAPAELEIRDGVVLAAAIAWDAAAARSSATTAADAEETDVAPAAGAAPAAGDGGRFAVGTVARGLAAAVPAAPVPATEPDAGTDASPSSAAPVTPTSSPVASSAGLIDSNSVPSVASVTAAASAVDAETLLPMDSALDVSAAGRADAGSGADDGPWDATVIRAADDAVRPPGPVRSASAPSETLGDHDGATISLAQARALRQASGGEPDSAAAADGGRDAASPVAPSDSFPGPLAPPRPPAPGRIRVSTGQVLSLDRTVVIGRRPRSTRVSGTDLPHLVAVDSPQQDISRSHLELRVEGESIVATDLRTTNGTTLLRAGADPVRLHPGEATVVVPGDVLDLGDGITVAVEEIS